MKQFYINAIRHSRSEREYQHIMKCLRRAKAVDDADYYEIIRTIPRPTMTSRAVEKFRQIWFGA